MKMNDLLTEAVKQRLDPKCWKGKHKEGTKIKGGVRVNNCVPNESVVDEMDKGSPQPGRDGRVSHSTYGSRDKHVVNGPDRTSRVAKPANVVKSGSKALDKAFKGVSEGSDERNQNALWAQITAHEKQAKATKNDIKKQHHLKMADQLRGQLKTSDEGVAEGEVVAFPKKHKADLSTVHSCPKCGGDLQGGKYQGHEVKVCMPCKQVYLPPNSGIDHKGDKIGEDWTKVNKHDKTDGMSSKAVKAYRRENPGSKLKTAVTTKPSKLKPGSKDAKRRKSFCARMSGNKGPMKKPNGKPTPKALALRRWNCESVEEMRQMIETAERVILEDKKRIAVSEIAGAFPSPSTRAQWAKDAAASNAAEAKRQAAIQAKADAQRLAVGTDAVNRQQQVNYHGANAPAPSNATWDGDSSFLDLDGIQYTMASRMPVPGGEPRDMKLIATKEGHQVYTWTRNSLKGAVGRYFYPAPTAANEGWSQKYKNSINCSNPKGFSQKAHCAGKKKK